MRISGHIGPTSAGDGVEMDVRMGRQGDTIVSELHGRFYEQTFRGSIFTGGMSALTSISNATFTVATTGATATPVLGLWNPLTSGTNAVILQAQLTVILTALQATGTGGFVWMVSTGNNAITTGAAPFNAKTLAASGSVMKNMSGVALTGMTGTLVAMKGSMLAGGSAYNASLLGTAAGFGTILAGSTENIDGSIIVPPGGVLALMATGTAVAHSAVSGLTWEEVPVTI